MEQINKVNQKRTKTDADENNMTDKARGRKKMAKEERIRLMEEKKLKKEVSFDDLNEFLILTYK